MGFVIEIIGRQASTSVGVLFYTTMFSTVIVVLDHSDYLNRDALCS